MSDISYFACGFSVVQNGKYPPSAPGCHGVKTHTIYMDQPVTANPIGKSVALNSTNHNTANCYSAQSVIMAGGRCVMPK